MTRRQLAWRLSLALLFSVCLCGPSVAADPKKPPKVTYEEHVLPLLKDKCVGCHNPDKKSGGLILNNYGRIMQGSSSGAIVKPGDPDSSPLFKVIAHTQEPFMPPKSPTLPKEFLDVIEKWIAGGALENSGSKAIAVKPKVDIGLTSVARGRPPGPPPMPPKTLSVQPVVSTKKANAVTALANNPWSPLVAVGGQHQVLLYNSDTLELLGVLPFPEGVPQVLRFSRNGSMLLAGGGRGGKSGRVVVWGVTSGERIIELGDESDSVLAADISPDQTQIALGGPGKVVRLYSTKDGKLQSELRKHTDWVTALEYSPDGVLLATGDRAGNLFVWEAFTGREYFTLKGHTAFITEISWRADGNVCASASEDSTVRLWEMENGSQIRSWGAHGGGALSVRYAQDGKIISCGRDRVTRVWDGNGGAVRAFDAHPDVALRATFSHDGARVFSGDWTGQVAVWLTADGKRVGSVAPNPPSLAEQLDLAVKEQAARQVAHSQATATLTASKAAAQKAAAELAAAQKTVTDTAAALKVAQDKLNQATAAASGAKAAVASAQADVRAKTVLSQALAEAATKVQAAAAAAKTDAALNAAAGRAKEIATQAGMEFTVAQTAVADRAKLAQAAEKALPELTQAVTAATSAAQAAPKTVEALTAAVKGVTTKVAADQAALDQATVVLNQATAAVERWKAAQAPTPPHPPKK
jgi:WD40 repeat protein